MNIDDSSYVTFEGYGYFGVHFLGDRAVARVRVRDADKVFLTGDFCAWQEGTKLERLSDGVWECQTSRDLLFEGCKYKYRVVAKDGEEIFMADPYEIHSEESGAYASVICNTESYEWRDATWLEYRKQYKKELCSKPLSIYKITADKWLRADSGSRFSYRTLACELAPYVKQLGCTHVQLASFLVSDGENTSYFAARTFGGHPSELAAFVDSMHEAGVGVILELPTKDQKALSPCDEELTCYADACAFWLDRYHADGLCVADPTLAERLWDGLAQKFPHAILVSDRKIVGGIQDGQALTICSHDAFVQGFNASLEDMRFAFEALMASPCKKLIVMGSEIGQTDAVDTSVDWSLLEDRAHAELQKYVAELGQRYISKTI